MHAARSHERGVTGLAGRLTAALLSYAHPGQPVEDIWVRLLENLVDRVSGPMRFRLFLQPTMAAIFAIRAGLKDARTDKPPYFWALLTNPAHRRDMLRDGWKDVGKVFALALVLDVVYQLIVARFAYPGEVVIVAFLLAIVPYLVLRGLITRIARLK